MPQFGWRLVASSASAKITAHPNQVIKFAGSLQTMLKPTK